MWITLNGIFSSTIFSVNFEPTMKATSPMGVFSAEIICHSRTSS